MSLIAVRKGLLLLAALTGCSLLFIGSSKAAKIEYVRRTYCNVLLSGPIEKGDLRRLQSALENIPERFSRVPVAGDGIFANICLNSRGGDLAEALAIVRFLAETIRYGTVVDEGHECLDACAFIFMAGSYFYDHGNVKPSRLLHVRGKLGFQVPTNNTGAGTYDHVAVQHAYTNASAAISGLIEIDSSRKMGSDRDRVMPRSLMLEILGREPEEPLILETIEQALRWNIALISDTQLKAITQRMTLRACANDLLERYSIRITSDSTTDQPIELLNNRATRVFKNLGPRKDYDCTVQVIRDANSRYFVNVNINQRGIKRYVVPFKVFLRETKRPVSETTRVGNGVCAPIWSLLPSETKLEALQ